MIPSFIKDPAFNDHPVASIVISEREREIIAINKTAKKLFGERKSMWMGKAVNEFLPDIKLKNRESETHFHRRGKTTPVSITSTRIKYSNLWYSFIAIRVISKSSSVKSIAPSKDQLKKIDNLNQLLSDFQNAIQSSSIVSRANKAGTITYVNENFVKISGYSSKELVGQNHRIINSGHHSKKFWTQMWKTIATGKTWRANIKNKAKNGSYYWVDTFVVPFLDEKGRVREFLSIRNDITSAKNSEEPLANSEANLRETLIFGKMGSVELDLDTLQLQVSNEFLRLLDVEVNDTQCYPLQQFLETFVDAEFLPLVQQTIEERVRTIDQGKKVVELEFGMITAKGRKIWIECKGIFKDRTAIGILHDVTERKTAEEKILKTSRLFEVTSQINQMVLRVKSKNEVFSEVCRIAIAYGKFQMAWIGLTDDVKKEIEPMTWSGFEDGYLKSTRQISIDDVPSGRGPTGTAMRECRTIVNNDIADTKEKIYDIWRAEALKRGFRSSIALPIIAKRKAIGVFTLYKSEAYFFTENEVQLLEEVTANIAFSLKMIDNESDRNNKEKDLERTARRLKLANEAAGLGVWQIDFANNTWVCDDRLKEILGIKERLFTREKYWEIIHPDELEDKKKRDNLSLQSPGTFYHDEYRIIRPVDNEIRYIKSRGIFFRDIEGNPLMGVSVVYDQTNEKLAEQRLIESLKEKEALIKEVHHRIKNNLQLISSILYLKMVAMKESEAKIFLADTRQKIQSIALIHERLLQSGSVNQIEIADYLGKLILDIQMSHSHPTLQLNFETLIESGQIKLDTAIYCGLILNELVTNSIKHAFAGRSDGCIKIEFQKDANGHIMRISDDGSSMPVEFAPGQTESFGMQLLDIFIKQLNGRVEIDRQNGTAYSISF